MYEPSDDSELLSRVVRRFAHGRVLDIGTGSGILVVEVLKKKDVFSVLGVDTDSKSISHCMRNILDSRASFLLSNRFSNVSGVFDCIVCNPPYLPQDENVVDSAIYGGREGQEFAEGVVAECGDHLASTGALFIITSSLSNEKSFLDCCGRNLFSCERVDSLKTGFETLTVWKIVKSDLRISIEKSGVLSLQFFAKGKRGFVLRGLLQGLRVAVKVKNSSSAALGSVENEGRMLKVVNERGIGPKFLASGEGFVVYKFVEGVFLRDVIGSVLLEEKLSLVNQLLDQCRVLDSLSIEKGEMMRPFKNCIITPSGRLVLIDFERSRFREGPKNERQALQFLVKEKILSKAEAIKRGKALKASSVRDRIHAVLKK